jgi:hypothetical protein
MAWFWRTKGVGGALSTGGERRHLAVERRQRMDSVLEWLTKYSPPIVFLIVLSAALIFVLKTVTENAISSQFEEYKKEMGLRLERRSNFEERILLDRYTLVHDIQTKIGRVTTDLNRLRSGAKVKGLIENHDIVPLTEVFDLLDTNRYLLTDRFYDLLSKEAQVVLKCANKKPEELNECYSELGSLQESFRLSMNEAFGIDKITWEGR